MYHHDIPSSLICIFSLCIAIICMMYYGKCYKVGNISWDSNFFNVQPVSLVCNIHSKYVVLCFSFCLSCFVPFGVSLWIVKRINNISLTYIYNMNIIETCMRNYWCQWPYSVCLMYKEYIAILQWKKIYFLGFQGRCIGCKIRRKRGGKDDIL